VGTPVSVGPRCTHQEAANSIFVVHCEALSRSAGVKPETVSRPKLIAFEVVEHLWVIVVKRARMKLEGVAGGRDPSRPHLAGTTVFAPPQRHSSVFAV
jgi:hypothetical protein